MNVRRTLSISLLILAGSLWAGGPNLSAQEHPAPAHQEGSTAKSSPAPNAAPEHAATGHEAPAAGHGETAHHGPEIKLFGISLGPFGQFLVKLFNFSVFFFGLFFLLKGALSSAFKSRTKELQDQLSQAERDKAQGEIQIKELDVKMAGLQQELDGIMIKAEADAETEKQRIIEAARQEADQILAQTRQEIAYQQRLAEQELRALVAELAVQGATDRLKARVQDGAAERVLDRSIKQVGGVE
ncbi:MAG: ATP synthase F0 subunit B [Holophaga sp.]|nr:ATP synthase F0 subunit B [Holophaga sp.]